MRMAERRSRIGQEKREEVKIKRRGEERRGEERRGRAKGSTTQEN